MLMRAAPPFVARTAKDLSAGTWVEWKGVSTCVVTPWDRHQIELRGSWGGQNVQVADDQLPNLGPALWIGYGRSLAPVVGAIFARLLGAFMRGDHDIDEIRWLVELGNRAHQQPWSQVPLSGVEARSLAGLLPDWWVKIDPEVLSS